jgi:hypothetical protein
VTHPTQVFVFVSQTWSKSCVWQSPLTTHSTHAWVVVSQTGPTALLLQSWSVQHPTGQVSQTWLVGSQ